MQIFLLKLIQLKKFLNNFDFSRCWMTVRITLGNIRLSFFNKYYYRQARLWRLGYNYRCTITKFETQKKVK